MNVLNTKSGLLNNCVLYASSVSVVDPGVVLNVALSNSVFGVDHEELADQVFEFVGDDCPNLSGEGELASFNYFEQFKFVVVEERYLPTYHSIKNYA